MAQSLLFGSWGDAMHDLICRCPKAQQPIDLQLYTDGVSLALCGPIQCAFNALTAVRSMRPKWERLTWAALSPLVKGSLKLLTLQPAEDALSARRLGTLHRSRRYAESSVTCLRHPSSSHGPGAFRPLIRSVAPLLEVRKLSAIEVKDEKPNGG